MNPFAHFTPAPEFRPLYNIGAGFDIPTGHYVKGKHGENILNGGLAPITGIGGRGNTYKTTVLRFFELRVLQRYAETSLLTNDTEASTSENRLQSLCRNMPELYGSALVYDEVQNPTGRVMITDITVTSGTKFFDDFKKTAKARQDNRKALMRTTPFISKRGELFKAMVPMLIDVDSLSRMSIDSVDDMLDKNGIGASSNNTEALAVNKGKHQMLIQLPEITGNASMYTLFTAHVDDDIVMDQYAPKVKKIGFLKNGLKFKYVPNQFFFLMNNLWYCHSAERFVNQTTKAAEFPRDASDTDPANCDLMRIVAQVLRSKNGPSGMPFEIVVSQSEGIQPELTELMYLRQYDKFGIGGHDRSYYLELCPDISLSRTTIRTKIAESKKLSRAFEITCEMCQIFNMWSHIPEELYCTPKELFEQLKAKGYDWDVLLNTRGYWVFEEHADGLPPFLSTWDLLEMRVDKYKPYWMK